MRITRNPWNRGNTYWSKFCGTEPHQIWLTFSLTAQLYLLGTMPKQVCQFSSLSIFCLGCKIISQRAACRLIVLHPKQNIESELNWQTC